MIDIDIYYSKSAVEKLAEQLRAKFSKDYPTVKVYISTVNPYNHWSQKLYNFYYNTELMEDEHENILLP